MTKRQHDIDNVIIELQELITYYKEHKKVLCSNEKRQVMWDIYNTSGDMYNKMRKINYVKEE